MSTMGWTRGWVDVSGIRLFVKHATSSAAAILCFFLVGKLLQKLLPQSWAWYLDLVDRIVLIGIFIFLGAEILKYLWKRLFHGTEDDAVIE